MEEGSTDRALDDLDEDAVIKPAKALFEFFRRIEPRQLVEAAAQHQHQAAEERA
jgi:hypothetical protein